MAKSCKIRKHHAKSFMCHGKRLCYVYFDFKPSNLNSNINHNIKCWVWIAPGYESAWVRKREFYYYAVSVFFCCCLRWYGVFKYTNIKKSNPNWVKIKEPVGKTQNRTWMTNMKTCWSCMFVMQQTYWYVKYVPSNHTLRVENM